MKNYKEQRPWGSFEILHENKKYKMKELIINPGGILSLQSHNYRNEHWTIVEGLARAHLDGQDFILYENMYLYVPRHAVHRLSNPSKDLVKIIEIQTGEYFGEDDIIRYKDKYNRN